MVDADREGSAMGPRLHKRSNLARHVWAMSVAACAHLLAFLLLGWRIPKLAVPEYVEQPSAAIELILVRPQVRPRERTKTVASAPTRSAPIASPRVLIAPIRGAPALPAPVIGPPAASVAEGPPDCATEDLPLLTDAEKARCRNAFDADRERRLARDADRRLAAAKSAPLPRSYGAEELAQFEAENKYDPVVVRKPHNGCLPRLADRPPGGNAAPPTRSGSSTAFGVGCAWSFR
jgi:hypothetical protein